MYSHFNTGEAVGARSRVIVERVTSAIRAARMAASLAMIAAITGIFTRVVAVNGTTAALVYLLAILGIASGWGLPEASVSSVMAMFCFNYFFLPPVGTFTIADPQNWVALLAFLVTAIVSSQLSASARRRAREAEQGREEMERLYELSRSMLFTPKLRLASDLPDRILRSFNLRGAAYYDRATGAVARSGDQEIPLNDQKLRDIAVQGTELQDRIAGFIAMPVSLGGQRMGSLALLGETISETTAHALANLTAIALESERARETANVAEAAQRNQELKSTLLDAVAHEFKTPLTSIKAAATALLTGSGTTVGQRELLTVVEEETDRMTGMVSEAIELARIEAGEMKLQKRPVRIAELVEIGLERSRMQQAERIVTVRVDSKLPSVDADQELLGIALHQLIANALQYSPAKTEVRVTAEERAGGVSISVADDGPGLSERDQTLVFERFYRGRDVQGRIPGTGMGLTIARQIVQAHGGRLTVRSEPGHGAEFVITLPVMRGSETR